MKLLSIKNITVAFFGILIGVVNGLLGAGGGMLAVPLLKKCGLDQTQAHINAVAVILPVCVVSAVLYLYKGNVTFLDAWPFIPSGILGSLLGTAIIKRISPLYLKRIFAVLMIYSGVRLILR